ncbi:hypothetical protein Cci01nite_38880 [Catellatospora citrea]|uniref:DDE superfamily endonuclease n=1 Tax=Catellatospora citrea TaxID=53366 RepID=A0A8J3KMV1_9ACTN|nr:hypothetical protein Cci01nite_38880 [Catellatospora citrea]
MITLVHLRRGLSHDGLAVAYGVDRSTTTQATGQIRPLLARRRFTTPAGGAPADPADVFAYATAEDVVLRMGATGIRVHRPRAARGGRKVFASGMPARTRSNAAEPDRAAYEWDCPTNDSGAHPVVTLSNRGWVLRPVRTHGSVHNTGVRRRARSPPVHLAW